MRFVASASASESIYGDNLQATSSVKTKRRRRRVLNRRQLVDHYWRTKNSS